MTTRQRRDRSLAADRAVLGFFQSALTDLQLSKQANGIALVAIGGYGRGELAPGSDLDLLILINEKKFPDPQEFVQKFLYPLWNQNWKVDYAIRTVAQSRQSAQSDLRVALGLLDARLISGEQALFDSLQSMVQKLWEKAGNNFLVEIEKNLEDRRNRIGGCAHLLEPDLKEARGGLRDITILRGLNKIASSADLVPLAMDRLAKAGAVLANVRDELHEVTNSNRDILTFAAQDQIAPRLGFASADELLLEVSKSARTVNYLMALQLQRLQRKVKRARFGKRVSAPQILEPGILVENGEILISDRSDPFLAIRAASLSANRGIPLNSESFMELANNFPPLPDIWPRNSREDFVAFLGAGASTISVFDLLDQEGLIERWFPEWKHLQFLPQRNALHRHTVDRHSLETVYYASTLTRTVRRPDLLLIAALFHDIGKGYKDIDHSEKGEALIAPLAKRLGFKVGEIETLRILVREHLTLSAVATRRDLDDPATYRYLQEIIPDLETLELLHALSIADGKATGKSAWSDWKAKLVSQLVARAARQAAGQEISTNFDLSNEQKELLAKKELHVAIKEYDDNFEIEVISQDRTGLLSSVAGVLSVLRGEIRSARTKTIGEMAIMRWIVTFDPLAPIPSAGKIANLIEESLNGNLDLNSQIESRLAHFRKFPPVIVAPPLVSARNDQATSATILEIRMHDQPGLLYLITKTLSRFSVDIRGALVSTLGAEALDTLYLTDFSGRALDDARATSLAAQLEKYLATQ